MNKIPAQKYPKKGILHESEGAARIYEIKYTEESEKNCNVFQMECLLYKRASILTENMCWKVYFD